MPLLTLAKRKQQQLSLEDLYCQSPEDKIDILIDQLEKYINIGV